MRAQDSEGWSQTRKENMPMTIQLYYYSICVKYEALVCLIFCLLVMCTMRAEDSEGWSQTPRENRPITISLRLIEPVVHTIHVWNMLKNADLYMQIQRENKPITISLRLIGQHTIYICNMRKITDLHAQTPRENKPMTISLRLIESVGHTIPFIRVTCAIYDWFICAT